MPVLALLLCACGDTTLATYNTPPEVEITSPADGANADPGDLLELKGVARDGQQDADTLDIFWTSSLDGELGSTPPDIDGFVYLAVTDLSPGSHAITLTAVDLDGESEQDTITLTIGDAEPSGDPEGDPTVILLGPADGTEYLQMDTITVVGTATDEEQAWDTLGASIVSSIDGTLWTGSPLSTGGISQDLTGLSPGGHVLSLVIQDDDLNVADASVSIVVLEDGSPSVEITNPSYGDEFYTDEEILLEGELDDDVTALNDLEIEWYSDVDGILSIGRPDSSGYAADGVYLSEGIHVVTLTAWDEDENEGLDSVTITVVDPANVDDDGDGQTENEGDCDDADADVYTGAVEACDGADNDCDGDVNEDWEDTYEPNDSSSDYSDLGEVDDNILWLGDSLTISGLTSHNASDEDWFYFNVNAAWYDPANFSVEVSDLDTSANWVIELYELGSGSPEDTDAGTGSLRVSYTDGDILDPGPSEWLIRVYTTTWGDSDTCATTYTIEIDA